MSSIDERVVDMKFNNAQFERGARQSLGTLAKLKKGLSLEGAKKGLTGLAQAGKNFSLGGIASGVQTISSRFSAMGVVGVTALANIANRAVSAGITLTKALTIDPVTQGLSEYELKLGSIQTILANTEAAGTSLGDVNKVLDDLNTYADQTIYNFGEMTRNIGTFTAAGVDLETSTNSIKGIANLAALSGSNSNQASTAMYQLSQAISAGRVSLMDWNSVVNAGMGGSVFQRALAETAVAMGELDENALTLDGKMKNVSINGQSFRDSISSANGDSWLSSDVLTSTLAQFSGDLSDAELAAQGFTDAQIESIKKTAESAKEAATVVKTGTQLIDTLKEGVGSGWAQTWEIIIGDFEEAKELWTGVSNAIGGIVENSATARNELLGSWKELGGRDELIGAFSNSFEALLAIIKPIKEAFQQIFPPVTAKTLYEMSVALREFTEGLKIGEETAGLIKRSFAGFFAVLGIGWEILKGAFGLLLDLFGVAQDNSGSFLEITASIGDFLVALHKTIKEGEIVGKVFDVIGGVVKVVAGIIGGAVGIIISFGKAIASVFSGGGFDFDIGGLNPLSAILDKLIGRFKGFGKVISWVVDAAKTFGSAIKQVWGILSSGDFTEGVFSEDSPIVDWIFKIREGLETFGVWLKDFFSGFNFSTLLDVFNTGLFAGLVLLFSGFFKDIKGMFGGGPGGLMESITSAFDGVTGSLEAMQASLKADTLLKIAGAIAILAAAVLVISLIDSEDLTKSLTAITVMFVQLGAAMKVFEGIASGPGMVKMPLLAASMILLAIAINVLALAVRQMSGLSWEELAKGLTGVAAALGLLAGWARIMDKQSGSLVRAAAAMILVGVGVKILASAVDDFSDLSWEELLKGLAGLGGVLLAVAGFGRLGGGGTLRGALSMVIVGAALKVLIPPLKDLGTMDQDTLIQGLIGIAGAMLVMAGGLSAMSGSIMGAASLVVAAAALWVLVPLLVELGEMSWNEIGKAATMLAGSLLIIAGGMYLMTGIIAGAASLLVAVAALWVLVPLLVELGEMSWNEIGKAATMLAGSLLIIAGGLYLMTAALPGAAALIVVAAALSIMTPVLLALSELEWSELLVGLAALGGIFLVLGLAGIALIPALPGLFGLGAAILLLGAGAALAGAGMLAFSIGFTAFAAAAAINGVIIIDLVKQLIGLIPYAAEQIGLGIVSFAQVIIAAYPVWVQAMITVLTGVLTTINVMAPRIVQTLFNLVMLLVNVLVANVPTFVQKGFQLLLGIMRGIRDNIQEVVEVGLEIIQKFIEGVENGLPDLVDSAYDAMITFIDELAETIEENQSRMEAASRRLAEAIINALIGGIGSFIGGAASAWRSKVGNAISNARSHVVSRAKTLASNIIDGLRNRITGRISSVASSIKSGVGNALNSAKNYVYSRAKSLAGNIISGMKSGITGGAGRIASAARTAAGNALSAAKRRLGIKSPSREFMKVGKFSSEGLALGIEAYSGMVSKSADSVGTTALKTLKESVSNIGSLVESEMDTNPTVRPVLDLSSIRKDAGRLSSLVGMKKIEASLSYDQASEISSSRNSQAADANTPSEMDLSKVGNTIFNQYNTSPKALSSIEIYRNTKNQLSSMRGAMTP